MIEVNEKELRQTLIHALQFIPETEISVRERVQTFINLCVLGKKYIIHDSWLGKNKVEVEIIKVNSDTAHVKAIQGCPFDMWQDDSSVPSGARCVFHNDTNWFDSKIVPLSQIITEKNDS